MEDLFKVNMMLSDIMVQEDDQVIIGGLVIFNDVTGAAINMLTHMSQSVTRKALTYMQEAYPIRPKEMHFFNIPSFFDAMMSLIKPFLKQKMKNFLKQKMKNRIRVHNTSRIEEMYQYIPKSVLPTEYGGDAGPIQDLIDYWKKKVEDHAEWLIEDANYVSDESKRIGTPKTATDLFGMEGSFRKLNVD
ncbi:CRAL/TRIO domain [Popillia japonica]|uniref:CRAL/TRIO domain n=1 Tax=Popillia japonica TaxID=7064 RepID=A0AAW1L9C4_POPJA